jgi:hypothetical protein
MQKCGLTRVLVVEEVDQSQGQGVEVGGPETLEEAGEALDYWKIQMIY